MDVYSNWEGGCSQMVTTKYEVVEKDEDVQDAIISSLVDTPTQGIAYMCLRSGKPMSATEIIDTLALSDSWFTAKFNDAVRTLTDKGLIKEVG
jgi:hypothetical protein